MLQSSLPISPTFAIKNIRNYLAGRFVGATRDQALMDELFKCLFAKHWLLKLPSLAVDGDLSKSYRASFAHVKQVFSGVFLPNDELELDPAALSYVDQQLDVIGIGNTRADVFGELYMAFAGSGMKADEGQFFTPPVAVDLLVNMVDPKPGQEIGDPACGFGGFLIAAAKHLYTAGMSVQSIAPLLHGVDKDAYLARLTRGRLALFLDNLPDIECADSLTGVTQDGRQLPTPQLDIIFTNPPFGAKIMAADPNTMAKFELAKKWKKASPDSDLYIPNGQINLGTPPQVLFLELCLKWLKPGGILGAILPESLISTKSYSFVVQYLRQKVDIVSVVGMPEALFKTSGKGGTHTKTVAIVVRKKPAETSEKSVFFANAKWCGHDSRGRAVPLNDIPKITENFVDFTNGKRVSAGYLGVLIPRARLSNNLAPRAFEYDIDSEAQNLEKSHEIITIQELIDRKVLSISTGDEVGKLGYGTGEVPFIRTSDLSNWEIKLDPKHNVSREIYEHYRIKQDVRPGDILMVKDGTYLIGTCAIITKYDIPMIYQSHLYKIRVNDTNLITSYLLIAALNSDFVQRQIKSFCVSQDIIDSLGGKIRELRIPIPKSQEKKAQINSMVEKVISDRMEARELARKACDDIVAVD
jgi:type I restriction enzyme M protein